MCGIFGMISKKSKAFNKRAFCTMGARNDSRGGDSCGVFIDGKVEYGVDKEKFFISFFRGSELIADTTECKVALGHCRKASVGKVSVETAQPVVIYNENKEVDYVLIHNGTIYNYKELAKKYIPDINIDGLTDSQVMARIFYHRGYDALDEYQGGAVFVIHDYRINKSFVFKGHSKKYSTFKEAEEERPLYYCWHNGRFVFSSIFETLYAFYYEEDVYTLPHNKLLVVRGDKLKTVKTYPRDKVTQSKNVVYTYPYQTVLNDGYDDDYRYSYGSSITHAGEWYSFLVNFNGSIYVNNLKQPMHGIFKVSTHGYVYPNLKKDETWTHEVAFFNGRMLKSVEGFKLINKYFHEANNCITPEIKKLVEILDYNPFSDDGKQYYWYSDDSLILPQNEWSWPMVECSITFNKDGKLVRKGKSNYSGWTADYYMYTYEEEEILKLWKKVCAVV